MSTTRTEHAKAASPAPDASRSVRWRIRAAMLTLVLVPTMAGVYLMSSQFNAPDAELAAERMRDTSAAAASLLAREAALETRLLVAANDPTLARLADGISGRTDKETATRILHGLRSEDASAIIGACIVRSGDGARIPLGAGKAGLEACADRGLRRRVLEAKTDAVTRGALDAKTSSRLLIATPMRSVTGRNRGVLSAEVDVAALLDRTRLLGGDAVTSMLVDMGSSEVVAAAPAAAGPAGSGPTLDLAALESQVGAVVGPAGEAAEASEELRAMGLVSTVVPLWGNGDGTRMGLVQLWPDGGGKWPLEVRVALLALLIGAIVAVIVLVRYFLDPFQEIADSRAELQELYREARQDALADGLTGLGNHRAFQEQLAREVQNHEDVGAPFTLLLMDLDDLKLVNDRDGHSAGDEMLVSMARNMRDFARGDDHVYRIGGDEFAMILPYTDIEEAIRVAERILYFCKRPRGDGRPCPFSAGVSGVPRFAREPDKVYRQADAALYWAKRNYRGSVEVFDPERDLLLSQHDDGTASAVAEVVSGKLLTPVFQPIVDLRTGRILGFEGLIRPDPDGPLPDTTSLFAAAEAAGRTVDLDLACIETIVNAAGAIGADRLLTLNLSPRTLEVKDFDAAWLLSGLVRNGISPSRVIIELTEREEIDDMGRLQQTFDLLQQYGLRLAADDVGAGNAGLRLLSEVRFDIVKIDLALVQRGVHRENARAVLESLRELALSQNARMIAEGVETARQLQVIREMDIGAAQGFLLGRPDASVDKTFVDVARLESGVVLPREARAVALPGAASSALLTEPSGTVAAEEVEVITDERRAIFLPSARPVLEVDPGPA